MDHSPTTIPDATSVVSNSFLYHPVHTYWNEEEEKVSLWWTIVVVVGASRVVSPHE